MINASIPELKKVRTASVGVFTIASPRRLNEVFMMTGTPVRLPNSLIRFQYSGLISFSTVCGRALPSTCVTEGTPPFAELDCIVHLRVHFRIARIGQDRPVAQGARAEFHSSLKPADDF